MPTVEVLLHGYALGTDLGSAAFCSIALVRGEKLTLVDSGHVGRRQLLVEALKERGLSPSDIDFTVATHAHWDHAQNYDLFDGAPILIHSHELKYARKPHRNDWATPRWTVAMLDFESKVQQVEDGHEIEPGVRIIHTPGHSAGTIAVLVDTGAGRVAITGDGIQTANVALSRTNLLVFWNEADARRSIERILSEATVIYPGHDWPFRLASNKVEYLHPRKLTLRGMDQGAPEIAFDPAPRLPHVMPGIEEQTVESLG